MWRRSEVGCASCCMYGRRGSKAYKSVALSWLGVPRPFMADPLKTSPRTIKCYCGCGDVGVGKTCLLMTYTSNTFPTDYVPAAFDNFRANVIVDGQEVILELWDFAPRSEQSERTHALAFPLTDVFLVQFSIARPPSLERVKKHWVPLIRMHSHCKGVPIVLVGNQADLRDDRAAQAALAASGMHMVTVEEAEAVAKEIGALQYLECSALNHTRVETIFDVAIRAANQWQQQGAQKRRPGGGCLLQ